MFAVMTEDTDVESLISRKLASLSFEWKSCSLRILAGFNEGSAEF